MRKHAHAQAPGVGDLMARLVDGLGELISQHVALARLELRDEAHGVARVFGMLALVVPLLLVGYAMMCFSVAFALSTRLGVPGAVALIGGANLLAGALGLLGVRRTLQRPHLPQTSEAVRESATALVAEAREVRGVH